MVTYVRTIRPRRTQWSLLVHSFQYRKTLPCVWTKFWWWNVRLSNTGTLGTQKLALELGDDIKSWEQHLQWAAAVLTGCTVGCGSRTLFLESGCSTNGYESYDSGWAYRGMPTRHGILQNGRHSTPMGSIRVDGTGRKIYMYMRSSRKCLKSLLWYMWPVYIWTMEEEGKPRLGELVEKQEGNYQEEGIMLFRRFLTPHAES